MPWTRAVYSDSLRRPRCVARRSKEMRSSSWYLRAIGLALVGIVSWATAIIAIEAMAAASSSLESIFRLQVEKKDILPRRPGGEKIHEPAGPGGTRRHRDRRRGGHRIRDRAAAGRFGHAG